MKIRSLAALSLFTLFSLVTFILPQSTVETEVLKQIQQMLREDGRVTFSSLYNEERFTAEQKTFLGRLYEVFFAIPAFLKSEQESTGEVPSRRHIAQSFGISTQSVELLLTVMEADQRMPQLFGRDPQSREITTLNRENIELFLASKGTEVKMTQWEGKKLPEFSLPTLDGKTFPSAGLQGKHSLIYFWFTGCPPCVRIAPLMAELSSKHGPKGLQFVGINADELLEIGTTDQSRREYVKTQGLDFTHLNLDSSARNSFGNINVYPTIFLADKTGAVRFHLVNYQSREKLEAAISELMAE